MTSTLESKVGFPQGLQGFDRIYNAAGLCKIIMDSFMGSMLVLKVFKCATAAYHKSSHKSTKHKLVGWTWKLDCLQVCIFIEREGRAKKKMTNILTAHLACAAGVAGERDTRL